MFEFYTRFFTTVELNNTFYKLPDRRGVEQWRDLSPPAFRFAAKASRYLTHLKKLKDTGPGITNFFERLEPLGDKLGPIVIQLPPHWEINAPRLDAFLDALPPGRDYALEPRDPTWHTEEIYEILRRHRSAFCLFEIGGFRSPMEITTDFVYVRLHGPAAAYQTAYTHAALEGWAERIREWQKTLRAVYLYFDNDSAAYAIENALYLKQLLAV